PGLARTVAVASLGRAAVGDAEAGPQPFPCAEQRFVIGAAVPPAALDLGPRAIELLVCAVSERDGDPGGYVLAGDLAAVLDVEQERRRETAGGLGQPLVREALGHAKCADARRDRDVGHGERSRTRERGHTLQTIAFPQGLPIPVVIRYFLPL